MTLNNNKAGINKSQHSVVVVMLEAAGNFTCNLSHPPVTYFQSFASGVQTFVILDPSLIVDQQMRPHAGPRGGAAPPHNPSIW